MSFGKYFKELRKTKGYTQERIASAIGKSKMLVSGVETGRNDAFVEDDLEIIADLFKLSSDEKNKLFYEASMARSRLPIHFFEYMNKHNEIYNLLEIIVEKDMGSKMLKIIKSYVEGLENVENN